MVHFLSVNIQIIHTAIIIRLQLLVETQNLHISKVKFSTRAQVNSYVQEVHKVPEFPLVSFYNLGEISK